MISSGLTLCLWVCGGEAKHGGVRDELPLRLQPPSVFSADVRITNTINEQDTCEESRHRDGSVEAALYLNGLPVLG